MSNPDLVSFCLALFHFAVVLAVLVLSARAVMKNARSMRIIIFTFAIASILLSDAYWIVHDLLRPEIRMPFAANEISEWAFFLLIGTLVPSPFEKPGKPAVAEAVLAAVFVAENAVLWFVWSGEWLQDLLTGLSFAFFACRTVAGLKRSRALRPAEWILLCVLSFLAVSTQAAATFSPGLFSSAEDFVCFGILAVPVIYFAVRSVLLMKKGKDGAIPTAFVSLGLTMVTMYMTAGVPYSVSFLLSALLFPLLYAAVRKEAKAQ